MKVTLDQSVSAAEREAPKIETSVKFPSEIEIPLWSIERNDYKYSKMPGDGCSRSPQFQLLESRW
jgi:hypothetical protein